MYRFILHPEDHTREGIDEWSSGGIPPHDIQRNPEREMPRPLGRGASFYPAVISLLYAVSDEIHQSFIPNRTCSMRDVFIDFLGILGFYAVIKILTKNNKLKSKNS